MKIEIKLYCIHCGNRLLDQESESLDGEVAINVALCATCAPEKHAEVKDIFNQEYDTE